MRARHGALGRARRRRLAPRLHARLPHVDAEGHEIEDACRCDPRRAPAPRGAASRPPA